MKFILLLFLSTLIACKSSNKGEQMDSEYTISTASESEQRAKSVLPLEGKEDVSKILTLEFKSPKISSESEDKEYFANEKFDWILTMESQNGTYFNRDSVSKYFDAKWRENHQYPWLYCIPRGDSKWTYLSSSENRSNEFSRVALAWKLYDPLEDPPSVYEDRTLKKYKESVSQIAIKLKSDTVSENFTIEQATRKSKELSDFISNNNHYSVIILKAESEFEGKEIWDVMMSLGLKWGDMDLFHWNNDFEYGDDQLMSVWTSTSPGYFFPEEIAAGKVKTNDLVFGFSIPRSISPIQVLEVMNKATEYTQSRLGGRILNENGQPFDIEEEKDKINEVVSDLKNHSIIPGVGDALYLFQ
ncbi:cell division protein ZipA C-terminal FtsZ-binding domain-containing protein [Algoriphagus sp. 4150]|uniref:cell division protein ZipA C-terminal FtsZ-binding domain-containing protein n=1 Tax=Algoriphagus sp. 4150 TaxID=2817756 RepID=UPI00286BFF8D|nr:cell division protein ZipA C-terminal FtsZ-binding domain-containing protein [Algoriphagus sp. 4150]